MTGRTFDGVDGVAHARDPTLYIFAVHDDGHTKMAGWRIASVSATPGKTKHFQTLRVPDVPSLLLCDCPGLVFPTVAGSKAQMLCDGILPADQMRDCMPPIRRLYALLGPPAFFHAYGVRLRTDAEREDDADAPALQAKRVQYIAGI